MSEKIEVGDLVVVVKPAGCCGGDTAVGKRYTVTETLTPLVDPESEQRDVKIKAPA